MGDYRTIGILSALPIESELIRNEMSDIRDHVICGMTYYEGKLRGKDVILSNCGVSKVNASMFTQILIDSFRPDCILFTGVAGSMDPEVRHMDLVIGEELTYFDVNPKQLMNCFPNIVRFRTDDGLRRILRSISQDYHEGLIITGDRFVHDKRDKKELKESFPDALCVEMEGCAVSQVCSLNGVPLSVLRCITDLADDSAEDSYKEFERIAAERSADTILKMIKELG